MSMEVKYTKNCKIWFRLSHTPRGKASINKLLIPCSLSLPIIDGYQAEENCLRVVQTACKLVCNEHCILPGKFKLLKCVFYTKGR